MAMGLESQSPLLAKVTERTEKSITVVATICSKTFTAATTHGVGQGSQGVPWDGLPLLQQKLGQLVDVNRRGVVVPNLSAEEVPEMFNWR